MQNPGEDISPDFHPSTVDTFNLRFSITSSSEKKDHTEQTQDVCLLNPNESIIFCMCGLQIDSR